ncbi:gp20 [Bacillus phage G]|uniref:Gp20 n=1 Tax=Bacillus phage G TaxID=2884420 RepID=G3MB90_9CAUD|nr:gp20 [Bacillus phage G]AEO93291.1 gp20 [Bacillus phage G]
MSKKISRLKKTALMPTQMFESQLDQISDKGRDVLKALEDYKFFVDQTSRVMKNDPALIEVIVGKKKNLEEASAKIYDIVFDIENLDISALYERQEEKTNENQGIQVPESQDDSNKEEVKEEPEKDSNEEVPKEENKEQENPNESKDENTKNEEKQEEKDKKE